VTVTLNRLDPQLPRPVSLIEGDVSLCHLVDLSAMGSINIMIMSPCDM
jgi:hypothetical protein